MAPPNLMTSAWRSWIKLTISASISGTRATCTATVRNVYVRTVCETDADSIYLTVDEDLLGKWFAANPDKRKHIFLATKFAANTTGAPIDSSPEYCLQACDKSLKRLGLKQIDLYYVHRLDQKTPIEKTVEAMIQLKEQGKIKYLGLSEMSSDTLRRAHKVHPITAVQVEYSPFALDIEKQIDLLKTCRELGVAVVSYSPLSRGLLTGSLKGKS